MYKYIYVLILIILIDLNQCNETTGVFGKLRSGFEIARKLLRLDKAKGIAQLVNDAFGKTSKKGDNGNNIFSGFLRLFGLDSKKISAIAVNALIFIAQLISTSLSTTPPSQLSQARIVKNGTPYEWIMNNTQVRSMVNHIKDKNLPDDIVEFIKERSLDEETDCVQLLVCKSAPFIWGMQKALEVRNDEVTKGGKALFAYLPKLEEVEVHGDKCETKHPYCFIHI